MKTPNTASYQNSDILKIALNTSLTPIPVVAKARVAKNFENFCLIQLKLRFFLAVFKPSLGRDFRSFRSGIPNSVDLRLKCAKDKICKFCIWARATMTDDPLNEKFYSAENWTFVPNSHRGKRHACKPVKYHPGMGLIPSRIRVRLN